MNMYIHCLLFLCDTHTYTHTSNLGISMTSMIIYVDQHIPTKQERRLRVAGLGFAGWPKEAASGAARSSTKFSKFLALEMAWVYSDPQKVGL